MRYIGILILSLFIFAKIGYAHKISTFAYREGNEIKGEAYFGDGSPCIKCRVEFYDEKGNKIGNTTTDKKGKYCFTTNYTGTIKIKVIDGPGHLARFSLEGIKTEEAEMQKEEISTKEKKLSKNPSSSVSQKETMISAKISKEEIKNAVREVLREELGGIESLLMDIRKDMDKARLHDVIGGIGYIFGIWGIVAMLKYRKRS